MDFDSFFLCITENMACNGIVGAMIASSTAALRVAGLILKFNKLTWLKRLPNVNETEEDISVV